MHASDCSKHRDRVDKRLNLRTSALNSTVKRLHFPEADDRVNRPRQHVYISSDCPTRRRRRQGADGRPATDRTRRRSISNTRPSGTRGSPAFLARKQQAPLARSLLLLLLLRQNKTKKKMRGQRSGIQDHSCTTPIPVNTGVARLNRRHKNVPSADALAFYGLPARDGVNEPLTRVCLHNNGRGVWGWGWGEQDDAHGNSDNTREIDETIILFSIELIC